MIIKKSKKLILKINKFSANLYFMGLLVVLLLISIFIWRFSTNLTLGFIDNAYHLATAEGFARVGGITVWDFWNSLPLGRPNNYPPLFHLIFADALKLGIRPEIALKLMMEFFVVGGLTLFAFGLTRIFNLKVALWSVIILTILVQFISVSITVMPSAMVIFLSPLLFYCFKEKKWLSYIIILVLMFYLHLFLPFIVLLTLALYTLIFERKMFLARFKASLLALFLYSPWIAHIFLNGIKNIKYFDESYQLSRYQTAPQINIIFLVLAIISLLFLIIKKKIIKEDCFFLILAILFIVIAFFSTERALNGHLWVCLSLFIALFFDRFSAQIRILPYLTLMVIIFSLFLMPDLTFDRKVYLDFSQPTIARIIFKNAYSAKSREQKYQKLFSDMKNNSKEGEAIGTTLNHFDKYTLEQGEYQSSIAIFLAANANRPTINLYQPEYFYRTLPDLSGARLVFLNEKTDNLTPQYFNNFGYSSNESIKIIKSLKNNFVLISSYKSGSYGPMTDLEMYSNINNDVFLYKNTKKETTRETVPKFVFPFWLANTILVLLTGLLIFDLKKTKKIG